MFIMWDVPSENLDQVFSALGNPLRRQILTTLAENGNMTVTDIAAPFTVSLNAISKHVKVLEKAGLVQRDIRGREHYCKLNPKMLDSAARWLEHYRQFWTERLDAMDQQLRANHDREE